MTTVTAWKPTRWELDRLRDGKAHRDANPSTTPEGHAEDAALDAWLVIAEAAYAETGARPETGQDVGEVQSNAAHRPRGRPHRQAARLHRQARPRPRP
jgi:hypothetical protein